MFIFRLLSLSLFLFLLSGQQVQAGPNVEVELSGNRIQLDATTTLTISLIWPKDEADYSIHLPTLELTNLVVKRQGESQESFLRDGRLWIRKTFSIVFAPLAEGPAKIAAFTVSYIDPATQSARSLDISPQDLLIVQSQAERKALMTWTAVAALGGFLIGIIAVALTVKSRKKAEQQEIENQPWQAHALKNMQQLAQDPKRSQPSEILNVLSIEFRDFMVRHYDLKAGKTTEKELTARIDALDIPRDEKKQVNGLLQRLEEAKYMGLGMATGDVKRLQDDLIRFIESKQVVGGPQ